MTKKYLNALNINNIKFHQLTDNFILNKNSFLVSTWCFNELTKKTRDEYTNKVINPYTTHGLLAWARIPVYPFVKNSVIEKEGAGGNNFTVRFYPLKK